ncbi:MAG: HXXEE domain-containing protein [Flavobacteriales bacterium]|nr:HXXEE domain-containing protein [Flavobacteriales bacterium]
MLIMDFLRKHWYDLGGLLILPVAAYLAFSPGMGLYDRIVWLSLISLFLHQLEEYRVVGTFPGMINHAMFHSERPDRYPLNTNTSLIINVAIGWSGYFLAALLGTQAVWLGIASILVSLGNIVAHTIIFNIKGRTFYNAGMATSWLFLAPLVYLFFRVVHQEHLATAMDYWIGIPLGILINVFGVL